MSSSSDSPSYPWLGDMHSGTDGRRAARRGAAWRTGDLERLGEATAAVARCQPHGSGVEETYETSKHTLITKLKYLQN